MNAQSTRRLLALLTACVMLLSAGPYRAEAVTQEEIEELRDQRDELTAEREAQQAVIDALTEQQADVLETKSAMDERNSYTLEQMRLNGEEIALYDDMIAEKAKEVASALQLEEEQLKRYRIRVRAMEEGGTATYFAMLLQVTTLGEFLTTIDDIGEIMESDRELADDYQEARENTEAVQREYEEFKDGLEQAQNALEEEQKELQKEIDEANDLILSLTEEIKTNQDTYQEILKKEEEADRDLRNMMAELERERQAQAAASVNCTGSFIWPVPSCAYLTSRFGMRTHPILGTVRTHNGIDVGAVAGSSVLAADGGKVTQASDSGNGYGNCVIINHGNGYVTLYAHLATISVKNGKSVTQGQQIGTVGSTGLSTGAHLHYEVWLSGSRIDPEQFYTGLTYSLDAGV